MPRRTSSKRIQRLALWAFTFSGGILAGIGLVLLAQVRLIRYMRSEVDRIGPFGRFLGELTFPWRDTGERFALAAADVPGPYLEHGHHTGLVLVGFGLLGMALVLPALYRWRSSS